jgi:gliding motility-associated-like protein
VVASPIADFEINDSVQCILNNLFVFTNLSTVTNNVPLEYLWDFDDGNDATTQDATHTYDILSAGTHTILLIVNTIDSDSTSADCISEMEKTIYITPEPDADFSGLLPQYCIGEPVANLIPFIPGGTFSGDNILDSTFNPIQLGKNYIQYIIDVDGCIDTAMDSTLVVGPLDNFVDLGPDTIICNDDLLSFNLYSPGATYLWSTGETTPFATLYRSGRHTVTVTNRCGSVSDDIVVEKIDLFCDAFVPNAFTPDLNLINDYFFPYLDSNVVTHFEFIVVNRWGNIMYITKDFNSLGWDGTFRGVEQPQDAYIWHLNLSVTREGVTNVRSLSGTVQLLR